MFRLSLGRLHREQLHARLVQEQLEIVWLGKALDVLIAVAHQPNLNLVLAVHRKRVVDDRTAASADGEALEMGLLSKVRRHPDGLAAGRTAGTTDRRAADLFRRRDVAVEQRRREIADSHIVEAVAGFVSGQKRADIDAQRQEVANSVLVFGSGQSPDRRGPARIRVRRGGAVECRFEIADRRVVGRFVRPLLSAHGWHLAGPELPDDLLPLVLMLGHVGRDQVEREAALLLFLVMTRHAVLFNEREVRSGWGRR